MREKEKKVSIQKVYKVIVATISLIILIMSIWIIFDCFKKTPDRDEFIMNYSSTPSVDYRVYLKPNNFYESKFISKDKKYISNIIDYIDLDFSYIFSATKSLDSVYKYSIDAYISSQYETNGVSAELWKKSYNLVPMTSESVSNQASYKVEKNIKIDFNKYDSLAKKFKEEYGVMSDTRLVIKINISSSEKILKQSENISDSKTVTISMPLNKAVTEITVSGTEKTSKNLTEHIEGSTIINYVLLIPSIVLALISAPLCFTTFYKLFKITNVSQYIVEQKKILKNYSDIIAEVATKPDLSGLKLVEVKKFEDLLNIEEELRVPILFYELQDQDESWFVITSNTQAFKYVLRSNLHIDL